MRSEGGRRRGGIVRRHVAWPRFFFSFVGLGWVGLVGAVVVFLLLGENEYAKQSEREREDGSSSSSDGVLFFGLGCARRLTFLLICIFFVVFFFMFLDPPLFSCPSFSSSRMLPSPPPPPRGHTPNSSQTQTRSSTILLIPSTPSCTFLPSWLPSSCLYFYMAIFLACLARRIDGGAWFRGCCVVAQEGGGCWWEQSRAVSYS